MEEKNLLLLDSQCTVFDDVSARDLAQLGSQMTYSQTRINITGKPTRNRQKRKIFIVKETCFLSNIKFKISFQTHLASQESTVVSFFIGIPFLFPHKNSLCFHFHILDRDSTKNTLKLVGLIENNAFFFFMFFYCFSQTSLMATPIISQIYSAAKHVSASSPDHMQTTTRSI